MGLSLEEIDKRVQDSYELPNKVKEAVPTPMVTVRTSTFQHAEYIEKCIEGVLLQETDFPIEFIIGEDYSTDGTRERVFKYAEQYSEVIRVITADYNVGSKANGRRCIEASRGKYMAICEGDDYWTDPKKLQKQVDFLEANADYNICFHAVQILDKDGMLKDDDITEVPNEVTDINDLLEKGNFIHTPTVLFRNNLRKVPEELLRAPYGDFFMHAINVEDKKIKYFPEVMAVYREGVGVWSSRSRNARVIDTIRLYKLVCEYFEKNGNIDACNLMINKRLRSIAGEIQEISKQCKPDDLRKFLDGIYPDESIRSIERDISGLKKMYVSMAHRPEFLSAHASVDVLIRALILKVRKWFQ
ncbi:MAG: glycosyltransferase [Cyclobacteriaceae bacterium]